MKKLFLIVLLVLSVILFISSCAPKEGCAGNRAMLTAGAGRTKFNK